MPEIEVHTPPTADADHRLRKHADYQRVYREGRKQFSPSMSYFVAVRGAESLVASGPRVGLTAGKVLGNAVERNRIKRRMRDIVRRRVAMVAANADIVLHPRKSVLTMEFARLESEVVRIFTNIQSAIDKGDSGKPSPGSAARGSRSPRSAKPRSGGRQPSAQQPSAQQPSAQQPSASANIPQAAS